MRKRLDEAQSELIESLTISWMRLANSVIASSLIFLIANKNNYTFRNGTSYIAVKKPSRYARGFVIFGRSSSKRTRCMRDSDGGGESAF